MKTPTIVGNVIAIAAVGFGFYVILHLWLPERTAALWALAAVLATFAGLQFAGRYRR